MKRAARFVVVFAIGALLGRAWDRIVCVALGHTRPERAWVGDVKHAIHSGYRCGRCHKWAATEGQLLDLDDDVRGSGRRSA